MIALKKILISTDFSEASSAAVKYGCALAEAFRASLHVLHVIEEPFVYGWAGVPDEASFRRTVHEQAVTQLHQVLSEPSASSFKLNS